MMPQIPNNNPKDPTERSTRLKLTFDHMDSLNTKILDIDIEDAITKKMYKSLEKRLTLAIKQKEAADKERLQKELALAYERNKMEKLVEESTKLEQEAMENLKEFLIDRGHVVDILQEEISCKCLDVNLLKQELEEYQHESELSVTENYLCHNILNGVKGRDLASKEKMKTNKIVKSQINYLDIQIELVMDQSDDDEDEYIKKSVEESKRQEQEVMDNLKLQEFLTNHGHVVNMLGEEISCKFPDVNLLKEELQDYKDGNENLVTEAYLRPITQETTTRHDCECYKGQSILKGVVKERVVDSREGMKENKIVKSPINDSERIQELADSYMEQHDKSKQTRR
ncbi:hypothetical protein L1987_29087 [Smallanthus sonchifolius]|uniref:Uncharacterized protein n=1 Tax=Smallanthus sonchifolius TaxID=185202 RepID=A0ACB9HZK6_9ASTR|nr:hypothetical protein L1987_29087 [Smallanthus sonchifolius]